jgi:hypothetical protein
MILIGSCIPSHRQRGGEFAGIVLTPTSAAALIDPVHVPYGTARWRFDVAYKHIPFYNLDQAVGPGAPNQRTDVLLVQFFLRELFKQPDLLPDKPPGDLAVDGIFGPVTAQWINRYQKQLLRKGFSVQADGRVDPAQGELAFSKGSISHKRYTIWHMNQSYRKRHQQSHNHLERAPGVPAELAMALGQAEIGNSG